MPQCERVQQRLPPTRRDAPRQGRAVRGSTDHERRLDRPRARATPRRPGWLAGRGRRPRPCPGLGRAPGPAETWAAWPRRRLGRSTPSLDAGAVRRRPRHGARPGPRDADEDVARDRGGGHNPTMAYSRSCSTTATATPRPSNAMVDRASRPARVAVFESTAPWADLDMGRRPAGRPSTSAAARASPRSARCGGAG